MFTTLLPPISFHHSTIFKRFNFKFNRLFGNSSYNHLHKHTYFQYYLRLNIQQRKLNTFDNRNNEKNNNCSNKEHFILPNPSSLACKT